MMSRLLRFDHLLLQLQCLLGEIGDIEHRAGNDAVTKPREQQPCIIGFRLTQRFGSLSDFLGEPVEVRLAPGCTERRPSGECRECRRNRTFNRVWRGLGNPPENALINRRKHLERLGRRNALASDIMRRGDFVAVDNDHLGHGNASSMRQVRRPATPSFIAYESERLRCQRYSGASFGVV